MVESYSMDVVTALNGYKRSEEAKDRTPDTSEALGLSRSQLASAKYLIATYNIPENEQQDFLKAIGGAEIFFVKDGNFFLSRSQAANPPRMLYALYDMLHTMGYIPGPERGYDLQKNFNIQELWKGINAFITAHQKEFPAGSGSVGKAIPRNVCSLIFRRFSDWREAERVKVERSVYSVVDPNDAFAGQVLDNICGEDSCMRSIDLAQLTRLDLSIVRAYWRMLKFVANRDYPDDQMFTKLPELIKDVTGKSIGGTISIEVQKKILEIFSKRYEGRRAVEVGKVISRQLLSGNIAGLDGLKAIEDEKVMYIMSRDAQGNVTLRKVDASGKSGVEVDGDPALKALASLTAFGEFGLDSGKGLTADILYSKFVSFNGQIGQQMNMQLLAFAKMMNDDPAFKEVVLSGKFNGFTEAFMKYFEAMKRGEAPDREFSEKYADVVKYIKAGKNEGEISQRIQIIMVIEAAKKEKGDVQWKEYVNLVEGFREGDVVINSMTLAMIYGNLPLNPSSPVRMTNLAEVISMNRHGGKLQIVFESKEVEMKWKDLGVDPTKAGKKFEGYTSYLLSDVHIVSNGHKTAIIGAPRRNAALEAWYKGALAFDENNQPKTNGAGYSAREIVEVQAFIRTAEVNTSVRKVMVTATRQNISMTYEIPRLKNDIKNLLKMILEHYSITDQRLAAQASQYYESIAWNEGRIDEYFIDALMFALSAEGKPDAYVKFLGTKGALPLAGDGKDKLTALKSFIRANGGYLLSLEMIVELKVGVDTNKARIKEASSPQVLANEGIGILSAMSRQAMLKAQGHQAGPVKFIAFKSFLLGQNTIDQGFDYNFITSVLRPGSQGFKWFFTDEEVKALEEARDYMANGNVNCASINPVLGDDLRVTKAKELLQRLIQTAFTVQDYTTMPVTEMIKARMRQKGFHFEPPFNKPLDLATETRIAIALDAKEAIDMRTQMLDTATEPAERRKLNAEIVAYKVQLSAATKGRFVLLEARKTPAGGTLGEQLDLVNGVVTEDYKAVSRRVQHWMNTNDQGEYQWGKLVWSPATAFRTIGVGLSVYNEGSTINMAFAARDKVYATQMDIQWLKGYAAKKGFTRLVDLEAYFKKEEARCKAGIRLHPRGSKEQLANSALYTEVMSASRRFKGLLENSPHMRLMYLNEKYYNEIPREVMADLYADTGDYMIENLGDYTSAEEFYMQAVLWKPALQPRYENIFKGNFFENMGRKFRNTQQGWVFGLETTANVLMWTKLISSISGSASVANFMNKWPILAVPAWVLGYTNHPAGRAIRGMGGVLFGKGASYATSNIMARGAFLLRDTIKGAAQWRFIAHSILFQHLHSWLSDLADPEDSRVLAVGEQNSQLSAQYMTDVFIPTVDSITPEVRDTVRYYKLSATAKKEKLLPAETAFLAKGLSEYQALPDDKKAEYQEKVRQYRESLLLELNMIENDRNLSRSEKDKKLTAIKAELAVLSGDKAAAFLYWQDKFSSRFAMLTTMGKSFAGILINAEGEAYDASAKKMAAASKAEARRISWITPEGNYFVKLPKDPNAIVRILGVESTLESYGESPWDNPTETANITVYEDGEDLVARKLEKKGYHITGLAEVTGDHVVKKEGDVVKDSNYLMGLLETYSAPAATVRDTVSYDGGIGNTIWNDIKYAPWGYQMLAAAVAGKVLLEKTPIVSTLAGRRGKPSMIAAGLGLSVGALTSLTGYVAKEFDYSGDVKATAKMNQQYGIKSQFDVPLQLGVNEDLYYDRNPRGIGGFTKTYGMMGLEAVGWIGFAPYMQASYLEPFAAMGLRQVGIMPDPMRRTLSYETPVAADGTSLGYMGDISFSRWAKEKVGVVNSNWGNTGDNLYGMYLDDNRLTLGGLAKSLLLPSVNDNLYMQRMGQYDMSAEMMMGEFGWKPFMSSAWGRQAFEAGRAYNKYYKPIPRVKEFLAKKTARFRTNTTLEATATEPTVVKPGVLGEAKPAEVVSLIGVKSNPVNVPPVPTFAAMKANVETFVNSLNIPDAAKGEVMAMINKYLESGISMGSRKFESQFRKFAKKGVDLNTFKRIVSLVNISILEKRLTGDVEIVALREGIKPSDVAEMKKSLAFAYAIEMFSSKHGAYGMSAEAVVTAIKGLLGNFESQLAARLREAGVDKVNSVEALSNAENMALIRDITDAFWREEVTVEIGGAKMTGRRDVMWWSLMREETFNTTGKYLNVSQMIASRNLLEQSIQQKTGEGKTETTIITAFAEVIGARSLRSVLPENLRGEIGGVLILVPQQELVSDGWKRAMEIAGGKTGVKAMAGAVKTMAADLFVRRDALPEAGRLGISVSEVKADEGMASRGSEAGISERRLSYGADIVYVEGSAAFFDQIFDRNGKTGRVQPKVFWRVVTDEIDMFIRELSVIPHIEASDVKATINGRPDGKPIQSYMYVKGKEIMESLYRDALVEAQNRGLKDKAAEEAANKALGEYIFSADPAMTQKRLIYVAGKLKLDINDPAAFEEILYIAGQVSQAYQARGMYQAIRDKTGNPYRVEDGTIFIHHEASGQYHAQFWTGGLHQQVEILEFGRPKTIQTISSNQTMPIAFLKAMSLRMPGGLSGTIDTITTLKLRQTLGLETVSVVPHNASRVKPLSMTINMTNAQQTASLISEAVKVHKDNGRPVMIGVFSDVRARELQRLLREKGVEATIYNAETEAQCQAGVKFAAGKKGAVTIVTQVGGRGVDWQVADERGFYLAADGLAMERVLGQLTGRIGRQGDNGQFRVFVTMEDTTIFSPEAIKGYKDLCAQYGIDPNSTVKLSDPKFGKALTPASGEMSALVKGVEKPLEKVWDENNGDMRSVIPEYFLDPKKSYTGAQFAEHLIASAQRQRDLANYVREMKAGRQNEIAMNYEARKSHLFAKVTKGGLSEKDIDMTIEVYITNSIARLYNENIPIAEWGKHFSIFDPALLAQIAAELKVSQSQGVNGVKKPIVDAMIKRLVSNFQREYKAEILAAAFSPATKKVIEARVESIWQKYFAMILDAQRSGASEAEYAKRCETIYAQMETAIASDYAVVIIRQLGKRSISIK